MSAVSKESEDEAEAAGTSSMMESSMMEGEEYYNPDTTVAWSEKVSGGEQLCRICAGPNEYLIPIFSGEGLEHQLGMKIEKHLPIQVLEHDKLPVQVCYQCASTLIAWHDLVVGCVEAEKKLRQLYQQQNVEEEEEEDDFGDDDRTELFADPVDSEMAEDPLEPSTSTSTATRSTRSPRKKSVTRAKPKLKMTLVKTPAALPKSPPKLLQPKEEQVEADPATERMQGISSTNADVLSSPPAIHTLEGLPIADNSLNHESYLSITRINATYHSTKHCHTNPRRNSEKQRYAQNMRTYSRHKASPPVAATIDRSQEGEVNKYLQEKEMLFEISGTYSNMGFSTTSLTELEAEPINTTQPKPPVEHTTPKTDPRNKMFHNAVTINNGDNTCELSKLHPEKEFVVCQTAKTSFVSKSPPIRIIRYQDQEDVLQHNLAKGHVFCQDAKVNLNSKSSPFTDRKSYGLCSEVGLSKSGQAKNDSSCVQSKISSQKTKQVTHVKCFASKKGLSQKISHSSCDACGSSNVPNSDLLRHIQFKCLPSTPSVIDNSNLVDFQEKNSLVSGNESKDESPHTSQLSELTISTKNVDNEIGECVTRINSTLVEQAASISASPILGVGVLKVLRCKFCRAKFKTVMQRDTHVERVHEKNKCKICNCYLVTKNQRENHYKVHEERPKQSKVFLCSTCGKSFQTNNSFYLHRLKDHMERRHVCKVCNSKFHFPKGLQAHMSRLHAKDKKPFMCETCGRVFCTQSELNMHLPVHTGVRFACTQCDSSFTKRRSLKTHEILLHDKKFENATSFSCHVCKQRCLSKKRLADHMNTHTGERPYACNACDKTFHSYHTLYQHKVTHQVGMHSCNRCDKQCSTKYSLVKHKRIHHANKDLSFACKNCEKRFASKAGIIRHNRMVHLIQGEKQLEAYSNMKQSNTCYKCDVSFPTRVNLNTHLLTVHGRTEFFTCTHCNKSFKDANRLRYHNEAVHSSNKFPCTDCNKIFKTKLSWYQHRKRTAHLQSQKPFTCPTCGLVVKGKARLRTHNLLHAEKLFTCDVCGNQFPTKWEIRAHMRYHTGEKPYLCSICGRSFAQYNARYYHMKKYHGTT